MPPKRRAPKQQDLARRRQYLRAKRKYTFYKKVWQSIALALFVLVTVKIATSPIWLIRSAQQLDVSENHLLSDENIHDILPIPYPQSLLSVQPEALAKHLETYEPIEAAVVSRRLIPPGLHVRVQERRPVAISIPDTTRPLKTIPSEPTPFKEPGLLDAAGHWMPRNSFRELGGTVPPPALTVRGMRPSYQAQWQKMYPIIRQSPVKITAVDWTHPSNLVLQSELGAVHIGPYQKSFETQLAALDQLRSLNGEVNPEKVAFIDLQDPDNPVVEILQATGQSPDSP